VVLRVVEREDRLVVVAERPLEPLVDVPRVRVGVVGEGDGGLVPDRDRLGLPQGQCAGVPRETLEAVVARGDQVRVARCRNCVEVEVDDRTECGLRQPDACRNLRRVRVADGDHVRDVHTAALDGRLDRDRQGVRVLRSRRVLLCLRGRTRGSRCHRRAREGSENGDEGHQFHCLSLVSCKVRCSQEGSRAQPHGIDTL
jgi:hypothetical protein